MVIKRNKNRKEEFRVKIEEIVAETRNCFTKSSKVEKRETN